MPVQRCANAIYPGGRTLVAFGRNSEGSVQLKPVLIGNHQFWVHKNGFAIKKNDFKVVKNPFEVQKKPL